MSWRKKLADRFAEICDVHQMRIPHDLKISRSPVDWWRADELPSDLVVTSIDARPWAETGEIIHRRDLTDLAEPYLSAVKRARNYPPG